MSNNAWSVTGLSMTSNRDWSNCVPHAMPWHHLLYWCVKLFTVSSLELWVYSWLSFKIESLGLVWKLIFETNRPCWRQLTWLQELQLCRYLCLIPNRTTHRSGTVMWNANVCPWEDTYLESQTCRKLCWLSNWKNTIFILHRLMKAGVP
jgi:hypothetical protein